MDNAKKILIGSALASMSAGLASATTISTGFNACLVSPTQPNTTTADTFKCGPASVPGGYFIGEQIGSSSVTAIHLTSVQLKLGMTLYNDSNLNLVVSGGTAGPGSIKALYDQSVKGDGGLTPAGFATALPTLARLIGSTTVSATAPVVTNGSYTTAAGYVSSSFNPFSETDTATTASSAVFASSFYGKFVNSAAYSTTAKGSGTVDSGGFTDYDDTAAVDYFYTISEKNLAATPEPASMALMGSALLGLGLAGKKRLRRQK